MSRENVEILRHGADVFNADLDRWVAEFFAPDVEWRTAAEDPDAAIHRGREAFRRYLQQWMDSFDGLRADIEEYIDAGDDQVFTWVRWTGRGHVSGVDADWHLAVVYTLRDGRVVRGEEYFHRAEALEAVGLSE
jgi:ketosteroid isomerase-like protein